MKRIFAFVVIVFLNGLASADDDPTRRALARPSSEDLKVTADFKKGNPARKLLDLRDLCPRSEGRLVDFVADIMKNDNDERVRAAAAESLAHCGDAPRSIAALKGAAGDSSAQVRLRAAASLRERGSVVDAVEIYLAEVSRGSGDGAFSAATKFWQLKAAEGDKARWKKKLSKGIADRSVTPDRRVFSALALIWLDPASYGDSRELINEFLESRADDETIGGRKKVLRVLESLDSFGRVTRPTGSAKSDLVRSISIGERSLAFDVKERARQYRLALEPERKK